MSRADDALQKAITQIFGQGVIIGNMPELGGQYDHKTELDILRRLSIAFLDGFQNTRMRLSREKSVTPACPILAHDVETDLLRYLFMYYRFRPIQVLTDPLLALIN